MNGVSSDDIRIYPNQFILGPQKVIGLSGWQTLHIDEDIQLTVHPGLQVQNVKDKKCSLTLLGYILDAENPEVSDNQILRNLLSRFSSIDNLLASTNSYGGRWVIIAKQANHVWLFNDALGLRQMFFTTQNCGGCSWVGSQPGIIAEHLGLELGVQSNDFLNSYHFRNHPEYRWPATSTPYQEIKHLLPNHYLELRTGKDCRYWPDQSLEPLKFDHAIDRLEHYLTGLIEAANRRFDIALGITAGLDSRLVLAASHRLKNKLEYVTVQQRLMSDTHRDVVVPAKLLKNLGLPHKIIKAKLNMSAGFSNTFTRSVLFAHDHYGSDAEAILAYSNRSKVAMTGSGAEVGRCSFRSKLPFSNLRRPTAHDLTRLQWMDDSDFAKHHYQKWLDDLGDTYGVHILDLFEWEQGHGNWLAMTQLEFDSAWQDIFTPFNCRDVLTTFLSVDERYRKNPEAKLFHAVIKRLWPEVMIEPINPVLNIRQPIFKRLAAKSVKSVKIFQAIMAQFYP